MADDEYDWPIDSVRPGGAATQAKSLDFDFPPVTSDGAALASPSALAARAILPEVDHSKRTTVILTSVVVVVALAAAGGFALLQRKDVSQTAYDSCQQSIAIYQSSTERLKNTVKDAGSSAQISADAVADAKTIDTLKTAISDAQNIPDVSQTCTPGAPAAQNQDADGKITAQTRDLGKKNENVANASSAVLASKATKEATDARQALTDQLSQVQALSTSANISKVNPNARKQLSEALNQVQQLLASDQLMSVTVYQNASKTLQSAVDQVNQASLG